MMRNIKIYLFVSSFFIALLLGIGLLFTSSIIDITKLFIAGLLISYPASFSLIVYLKKKGINIDEFD